MERLTFTDAELEEIETDCPVKNDCHIDHFCDNVCDEFQHNCPFKKMAQKIKVYEDAEEQGLLLRLPSKEPYSSSGDTVYYIFDYEVVECINCGVSMDCEGKLWIALACDEHIFPYRNPDPEHDLEPADWCINTTQVSIDEWGKTVFLTQEAAEQALKQMGE